MCVYACYVRVVRVACRLYGVRVGAKSMFFACVVHVCKCVLRAGSVRAGCSACFLHSWCVFVRDFCMCGGCVCVCVRAACVQSVCVGAQCMFLHAWRMCVNVLPACRGVIIREGACSVHVGTQCMVLQAWCMCVCVLCACSGVGGCVSRRVATRTFCDCDFASEEGFEYVTARITFAFQPAFTPCYPTQSPTHL